MKVFILLALLFATSSYGETKKKTNKSSDILNFEATVIEGERKNPSIFLDITIDKYSDLDSILLIRKNFNNFHLVDKDKRPMYLE